MVGIYFLGGHLLLIIMICVLIFRFNSFWDNTSGRCFIVFIGGSGDTDERDVAVLWLYINLMWRVLGELSPALVVRLGWSKHWAPRSPKAKLLLTILFQHFPAAFFFLWDLYWTIKLTIANQFLIDDNEYTFSFGQVGALVTLFLSFCRAQISHIGARRIVDWDGQMLMNAS